MCSKRIISVLTLIALMFSFIGVYGADYDSHWAYEYIDVLYKRNIISGDENGNLNPDKPITRAEFAKVINLFFEYTSQSESNFPDVSSDAWYAKDMSVAKTAGYFKGDEKGFGNPKKPLSRNEAAVVFCNILKLTDKAETGFNDRIDEWAANSALCLKKQGIMVGDAKGNFNGRSNITRAQAFKMLVASGELRKDITKDDVVSSGTLSPSGSSSGGGGGGGGGSNAPSAQVPVIKLIDTDSKNITWESCGAPATYLVTLTRLTNNYNNTLSDTTSALSMNLTDLLNSLMTTNKQIKEKFRVTVSASGLSSVAEFEISNPAVSDPAVTVSQTFSGEAEEISLNWQVDENAASYEVYVEFDNTYVQLSNSNGKAIIPDEYVEKINGKHNARIKGISNSADYLSTDLIDFEIELPMYAGKESGYNLIKNKRHFLNIRNSNADKYKLAGNITLGDYDPFSFGGEFNGGGYEIDLALNKPLNDDVGLFKTLFGAVNISNLTVTGYVTGNNYVGGVAGRSGATAAEAITSGAIISNCVNKANISANSLGGGFIGRTHDNSSNLLTFTGLINYGNITVSTNAAGGIAGLTSKNTVEYCINLGDVHANSQAGGLVGWSYNPFSYCYNTGKITGTGYVGGIAGQAIMAESSFMNCYNTGEIANVASSGGIAASDSNGKIFSSCYNTYPMDGAKGILGTIHDNTSFVNCYTVSASDVSESGITAISKSQLSDGSTFSGFDFSTVWTMDGNPLYDYPELLLNNHIVIPEDLPAPVITEIANDGSGVKVVYEPVLNAEGYVVTISEGTNVIDEVTTDGVTYTANLDKSSLVIGNEYTVTVKALGRDGVYNDSEASETYIFTGVTLSKVTNAQIVYNDSSDSYSLSFDESSDNGVAGYKVSVYEGTNITPVYETTTSDKTVTVVDFNGQISNDKIYTVKIITLSSDSESNDSPEATIALNTYFAGGNGFEDDPYLISKQRHFVNISKIADNNGVYYRQTGDLTLSGYTPFDFVGVYNGGNNEINLNASGGHYIGLFKNLGGNAKISDITIRGNVTAWTGAGSIAYSVLSNSSVEIKNIVNYARIKSDNHAGGIVCLADFTSDAVKISGCVNYGNVEGSVSNSKYVGGIIGYGKASISACANHGTIKGIANVTGNAGVGGIMGANRTSATSIINCYNTGIIDAGGNAGGIIGAPGGSGSSPDVKYSYTTNKTPIGNIIGNGAITCTGVYYLSESETDSHSGTTALNSTRITDEASFVGFDFASTWVMGTNGPELK